MAAEIRNFSSSVEKNFTSERSERVKFPFDFCKGQLYLNNNTCLILFCTWTSSEATFVKFTKVSSKKGDKL